MVYSNNKSTKVHPQKQQALLAFSLRRRCEFYEPDEVTDAQHPIKSFYPQKKGNIKMNIKLLKLLNKNARIAPADMATMLGLSEEEVLREIAEMERDGLIRGYKAVIDWDQLDNTYVSAIIELKVTPKAGFGFEDVAAKVMKYPEVESVYLMSGVYDLNVVVKGKSLQDVANFVAKELSAMESVTSTATHFVMRRYKELDVELLGSGKDERGSYLL